MSKSIIEVDRLSYKYPTSPNWVLKDISFRVEEGEFLGIVGPTGAGKTTLAMTLRALIPHNFGGTFSGTVEVGGQDTLETTPPKLAEAVGIVFQNPEAQSIGLTVLEDMAFGLGNLQMPQAQMSRRIEEVAELVDLEHLMERETWALSGGQKQRLAIGGVLAMSPAVLIMDEPTAELDPRSKREIFGIVERLRREEGLTIIMVEHEVEELAEAADRILVLDGGQMVALAPPVEVFRDIELFERVRERVPYVAKLLSELIQEGLVAEEDFTANEQGAADLLCGLLGGEI